jgi:hypothetical protein
MFRAWIFTLLCGACLLPSLSLAQAAPVQKTADDGKGPGWSTLSEAQRRSLTPLAADWASLPADSRRKWVEVATRLPSMAPEQQQRVQQRMNEWARMSPAERGQARLNFQQSKSLPGQDKQASWEAYQALPSQQREELAAKAKPASGPAAAAPAGPVRALRSAPLDAQAPKSNIVGAAGLPLGSAKTVAPTVIQSHSGATTSLVSAPPSPPAHQQAGQPKITASPGMVDKATLLPKRVASAAVPSAPVIQGPKSPAAAAVPAVVPAAPPATASNP